MGDNLQMSSPYGKATVIAGLTASGRPFLTPDELHDLLSGVDIEYEIEPASRPGDCTALARAAVEKGSGYLIWVGDDRVLHEVVNGILDENGPINEELVVAGIPGDAQSDFLKTMGLNDPPPQAIKHLAGEPYFGVDAGRITWGPGVEPNFVYFINMVQAGMAGEMSRRREKLPRPLGRTADLLAFWGAMARFEVPQGAVKFDRRSYGGPLANVIIGNGQFVRNGVRLALKAHPGDGKLDLLIHKGSKRDYVETMNLSLKGEHLPSPKIKEYLARRIEISAKVPLPVEVDGRLGGYTPAIFEVVPQAFRLKI